jgi:hypothetical protein
MTIYLESVEDALGHGRLGEIESAFERLVVGEDLHLQNGDQVEKARRERLLTAMAAVLANDDRPIPRSLAAVLQDLAPHDLNARPSFARAAAVVVENVERIAAGKSTLRTRALPSLS